MAYFPKDVPESVKMRNRELFMNKYEPEQHQIKEKFEAMFYKPLTKEEHEELQKEIERLRGENAAMKRVVEAARKADYYTRESAEIVRNAIIELDAIQKAAISHEKREQQG